MSDEETRTRRSVLELLGAGGGLAGVVGVASVVSNDDDQAAEDDIAAAVTATETCTNCYTDEQCFYGKLYTRQCCTCGGTTDYSEWQWTGQYCA